MHRNKDKIQNVIIAVLIVAIIVVLLSLFIHSNQKEKPILQKPVIENTNEQIDELFKPIPQTPILVEETQEPEMPQYQINVPIEWQQYGWELCQENNFCFELWIAVMYQESGFNLNAVGKNYTTDFRTGKRILASKDLGLMGLNDQYKETHASVAGIPIDEFDYFNPYHNIKAGILELVNHRDYWYEQGIPGDENVCLYMLNSFNMGRHGYKDYILASRGSLSRTYDQKVLYWKYQLELEGKLP
jgi:hypothetical protein